MNIYIPDVILRITIAMGFAIMVATSILSFIRIGYDWVDYTKQSSPMVRMVAFVLNLIILATMFILLLTR